MRKIHLKSCQKVILMAVVMLCSLSSLYAQVGQTVTGVVKDTEGEPLIGVSVLEIGTSNGAITNLDGQYTLTLTKNKSVLAFSYIGYTKQEISVSGRKSIIVVMKEDAVGLQEVIVTGYGKTVTKDKLTAAISKVSSEVLERGGTCQSVDGFGRYCCRCTCYADFRSAGNGTFYSSSCRCFFGR